MNSWDGTGRIANDFEVKKTQNGKSVTNISLAVKRTKEITEFIRCVVWGYSADFLGQYCHKGDLIGVYNGTLQSRKYEDKEIWEVHANTVELLEKKKAKEIEVSEEDLPF